MQRLTISIDDDLARSFDNLWGEQGYQNRSEAMRDLVRRAVDSRRLETDADDQCVASLSYVYDHHVRDLAARLMDLMHHSHDLVISTTHVHLDHSTCLECVLLKGPVAKVRALADAVRAERGVRFGEINLVSVAPNDRHAHDDDHHSHGGHIHLSPHGG